MSLANFSDLKTAIAEWLYRTGDTALAARAEDFIMLFEADFLIDPDMRTAEMSEIDTAPIGQAQVTLPDGYLDMIRLQVLGDPLGTPNVVLDYRTPAQAAALDATVSCGGTAQNYTVIANQIFISPQKWAPIGATLEMVYYKFAPLADSGTNWLMAKYPNLYLYGSLMQAAGYVDNDAAVAKWKAGRDEAMSKLEKTERKRKLGAGPLTIRNSVEFVT